MIPPKTIVLGGMADVLLQSGGPEDQLMGSGNSSCYSLVYTKISKQ